jgi:flagellar assembly protein FliH
MSSSPSRAPIPEREAGVSTTLALEAAPFPYHEAVLRPGQRNFLRAQCLAPGKEPAGAPGSGDDGLREAQWRELGKKEGLAESRARFEEQLAKERAPVAKAVADFSLERAAYYQKIEAEAVGLALSIARKILHREAQVDPLLLMGVVKIALEKIENATEVALLVNPQRGADWRRFFVSSTDPGSRDPRNVPEIVEDPAMPAERCVLRTSMGTAEFGVELQLKEIENGLMDLLAARPQGKL